MNEPDPDDPTQGYSPGAVTSGAFGDRLEVVVLDAAQEVDPVAAGVGHHLLTGHPGSGGDGYWCDECDFEVVDGRVWGAGPIGVRPSDPAS